MPYSYESGFMAIGSSRSFVEPLPEILLRKKGLFMKWEKPKLVKLADRQAYGKCTVGSSATGNCTIGGGATSHCRDGIAGKP